MTTRRSFMQLIAASVAAQALPPAAAAPMPKPIMAFSTRALPGYTGPLYRVRGFGDVYQTQECLARLQAWAGENPDEGVNIEVMYNQVRGR